MTGKIAFYLDNRGISHVDASEVRKANPGIGGTEYLMILVSSLLAERENGLDIKLYVREKQNVPSSLKCEIVDSVDSAIRRAEQDGVDKIVMKHDAANVVEDVLHVNSELRIVVWCHVFICYWELDYYANNSAVETVVFVGREMRDLYRDHKVFGKSTYIYNCVSLEGCRETVSKTPFCQRKNIVTYIGSIVPFKGLHLLAEAWPHVLAKIPDAQLFIIGTGKLYDSTSRLGKYGIAESSYEELIMKKLSVQGEILPSVHFMGRMGAEKNKVLLQTKVGVPNPSGITETFCLSAVEMQAFGARIATVKSPGYIDTVKNGILYSTHSELAETIVQLLTSRTSKYEEAISFFEKEFSFEAVAKQWEGLLLGNSASVPSSIVNAGYRLKWLKEIIRRVSLVAPLNGFLPPIERLLIAFERKVLHRITFMDSNLAL